MGDSYRADKSGFAAEMQEKSNSKYEVPVAAEVMQWVEKTLKQNGDDTNVLTSGAPNDVFETLKNGLILLKLLKYIAPNLVTKNMEKFTKAPAKTPFQIMENVGFFTDAAGKYGVSSTELFQTVDLVEKQNLFQVVLTLRAFSRQAMKHGKAGVGPKEAEKNKREFTEEQLRAGDGVIGLQMGSNKGATQAGMNFGNTRHIID